MSHRSRLTALVAATLITAASAGTALGGNGTPAATATVLPGVSAPHQAECGAAGQTRSPLGY